MNKEARIWFDYAYRYIGGFLPFAVLTGEVSREDLVGMTKGKLSDSEWSEVEHTIKRLYAKLPSEQAFTEEKRAIIPHLKKDLKRIMPYIDTVFSFGNVRGDIDIGMIAYNITTERIDQSIMENLFLVEKYPIVDWASLVYFLSGSPEGFVAKVKLSREQVICTDILPVEEQDYVKQTLQAVNLLWGNGSYIRRITSSPSLE
jgi:hypothetical protein